MFLDYDQCLANKLTNLVAIASCLFAIVPWKGFWFYY